LCWFAVCGCTFFDYDAIGQLPDGERASLPVTPEMATGELFIGRSLEKDMELGMTLGLGAATIAKMMRVKARERYDTELEAFLEHGDVWWGWLVTNVGDASHGGPWQSLAPVQQLALKSAREVCVCVCVCVFVCFNVQCNLRAALSVAASVDGSGIITAPGY
jgi:hypothetical protein